MIRAGYMRNRITIQVSVDTVDEWNTSHIEWQDKYKNIRAERKFVNGKEDAAGSGEINQKTIDYRIRYLPGLDENCRIIDKGAVYDIISIHNIKERNRELVISCVYLSRVSIRGV